MFDHARVQGVKWMSIRALRYRRKLMKGALTLIGFFLLAMGLFWAGQGADLIRWPAESFMVNARQWIYYGGGTAVIGLVLILLASR
jgi:uncharacterized membrane protein